MKYTHIILGGTGHIGSYLSEELLKASESVMIIGHSPEKEKQWIEKGAGFETADILDSKKLKALFEKSKRIFILNPPADPRGDAEATELKQIESILNALKGLSPEKIVMASTYGARQGADIFDLGTLYQLEQGLKKQGSPLAIIRSAYYMSNLDLPAQLAMESGKLSTVLPADFKLPMVSPQDIGHFAAQLLRDDRTGVFYLQAEQEYAVEDAAAILGKILQKDIEPNEIPEDKWTDYMKKGGFSAKSAKSFIGMTKLTMIEKFEAPNPVFGKTTLEKHLQQLVQQSTEK